MSSCFGPVLGVTVMVTTLPAGASVVPVMVGVVSLLMAGTLTLMLGGVRSTLTVPVPVP